MVTKKKYDIGNCSWWFFISALLVLPLYFWENITIGVIFILSVLSWLTCVMVKFVIGDPTPEEVAEMLGEEFKPRPILDFIDKAFKYFCGFCLVVLCIFIPPLIIYLFIYRCWCYDRAKRDGLVK